MHKCVVFVQKTKEKLFLLDLKMSHEDVSTLSMRRILLSQTLRAPSLTQGYRR